MISLDDEAELSVSSFRYHNTLYRQTTMFKIKTFIEREREKVVSEIKTMKNKKNKLKKKKESNKRKNNHS